MVQTLKKNVRKRGRVKRRNRSRGNVRSRKTLHKSVKRKQRTTLRQQRKKTYHKRRVNRTLRTKRRHNKRTNMRKTRRMNKRTLNKKDYYLVGDEYYQEGGLRGIRERMRKKNKAEGEEEGGLLEALKVMVGAFTLLLFSGLFFAGVLAAVPGAMAASVVPAATQLTSFMLESFAIFQSARIDKKESFDMVTAPNMASTYIQILANMVSGSDEILANIEETRPVELDTNKLQEANQAITVIKKNIDKTQSGRPSPVSKDADSVALFVASAEETIHSAVRNADILLKSGDWEQLKGTPAYANFEAGPKAGDGTFLGWEAYRTAKGKGQELRTADDNDIIVAGDKLAADFKSEVMKTQELPGKLGTPWEDLSNEDRGAATTLNWEAATWGAHTDKTKVSWSELTPEQQESAAVLGYDKTSWETPDPYEIAGRENTAPDGFSADLDGFTERYMNGEGKLTAIEEHTIAAAADSDKFAQLESETMGEITEGVVEGGAVVISGLLFRALKTSHERWINATRKNTVWDYWDRPDDSSILFLMHGSERSGGIKRTGERILPSYLKKMKVTWQDHYITRMNWNGFTDGGSFIMRRTMSNVAEKKFHGKMRERNAMPDLFRDPTFTTLEFDFHHVYATIREYIKPLKTEEKQRQRRGSDVSDGGGGEPTELNDLKRFESKKNNVSFLGPLAGEVIKALSTAYRDESELARLTEWVMLFLGGEVPQTPQFGEPQTPTATNVCDYLVGKSLHDVSNIPSLVNTVLNILALARYGFLNNPEDKHLDNVLPCKHLLEVMKTIDDGKSNEYSDTDIESYSDEIRKIVGVTLCRKDKQDQVTLEGQLRSELTLEGLRKHLAKKIHCLNRNIMNGFSELRRKHFESAGAASSKLNHRVFCMSDEAVLYGRLAGPAPLKLFHTYTDESLNGSHNNDDAAQINIELDQVRQSSLSVELNSTKGNDVTFSANIQDLDYAGMYDLFATTVHNTTRQTLYDSNTQNVLIQQLMREIKHFNDPECGFSELGNSKQDDIRVKWGIMKELKRHFTCNFFNDTCTGNDLFTKMAAVSPDEKGMNMRHELFNLWDVLPKIQDPAEKGLRSSRLPENFRLSKVLASEGDASDAEIAQDGSSGIPPPARSRPYLVPHPDSPSPGIPTIITDDAREDRLEHASIDTAVKDPYEQRRTLHSDEQENLLENIARVHLKLVEADSEVSKYMEGKLKEKKDGAMSILGDDLFGHIQALVTKLNYLDSAAEVNSPDIKDLTSNEVYKELAAKLFTSYSWAHSLMCTQSDEQYSITGDEGKQYFEKVEEARSILYTNDDMLREIFEILDKSILIPKRDNSDNTTRVGLDSKRELGQGIARTLVPPLIGVATAAATGGVALPAVGLGTLTTGTAAYVANKVDMVKGPRKKRLTKHLRSQKLLNVTKGGDGHNKQFALKSLSEIYLHKLIREGWIEIQGAHDDDKKEDLTLSVLLSVFGQGKPTVSLNLLSFLSHSLRVYKRATTFGERSGGKYISLAMDYVLILIMMTLTDVGREYEGIVPKNGEEPKAKCMLNSFLNPDFVTAISNTSDPPDPPDPPDYKFPEVNVWSPNEEFEPEPEPQDEGGETVSLVPPPLPSSSRLSRSESRVGELLGEGWHSADEMNFIQFGDTVRIQDEHEFPTDKIFRSWMRSPGNFVAGESESTAQIYSMEEVVAWRAVPNAPLSL